MKWIKQSCGAVVFIYLFIFINGAFQHCCSESLSVKSPDPWVLLSTVIIKTCSWMVAYVKKQTLCFVIVSRDVNNSCQRRNYSNLFWGMCQSFLESKRQVACFGTVFYFRNLALSTKLVPHFLQCKMLP